MPNLVKNADFIEIPDEYKPIFNSILMQLLMVDLSHKDKNLAVVHILQLTKEFYDNNPNVPPINP